MSWQVRMQADDFFNAHQALNKAITKDGLSVVSPSVVCLAFSLELYIKDIYYALGVTPPYSHSILGLYKQLPKKTKREIFFHEAIRKNPFVSEGSLWLRKRFKNNASAYYAFIKRIEEISGGFQEWRYSYESKRAALRYEEWFALALIEAVKSVADNTRTRLAA
jgi:hypothetical protein